MMFQRRFAGVFRVAKFLVKSLPVRLTAGGFGRLFAVVGVAAFLAVAVGFVWSQSAGSAPSVRIVPPDRSVFAVGQKFDLRVEAAGLSDANSSLLVWLNDVQLDKLPGVNPVTTTGPGWIAVTVRDMVYTKPVHVSILARLRSGSKLVASALSSFEVVGLQSSGRPVRNVILMIGDGMGLAHRTAARTVAKGLYSGRFNGLLEMDSMDAFGIVFTPSLNSFVTDSANGASVYAGGNKTDNGALCVWPDNTDDPLDNPRFENILSYLKRTRGMATGVVSTASLADATPAAFLAYSYKRGEAEKIVGQYPASGVDVLLGGGKRWFLPTSEGGSRTDGRNILEEFRSAGYACVTSAEGLSKLPRGVKKCLGLFAEDNMEAYVDRVKARREGNFTQPDLPDMTEAAIEILSRHPGGFMLMVEGASIDKVSHRGDAHRAIWETIEFDRAVGAAKRFAKSRGDTLVIVTADHETGGMALRALGGDPQALEIGWGSARSTGPFVVKAPAPNGGGMAEPPNNPFELPSISTNHTASDVVLSAYGAGAQEFVGAMDATEVFLRILKAVYTGKVTAHSNK
ncbi:MAG: alkaline phosphatase [Armatimonadota bacterium]